MLLRSQLGELARTFTNGNVGHMERLYLQDIVLHSIYHETVDELVLKGGTALFKLYNLDRFSEDLDFTAIDRIEYDSLMKSVERDFENFGMDVDDIEKNEDGISFSARISVKGPLYSGTRISMSYIRIEVNKRASVSESAVRRYTPNFPDIPSFDLVVLSEREIVAEKIRAICTRNRPRDVYDLYHLLKKGVEIDRGLVEKKLAYYGRAYDPPKILNKAKEKKRSWQDLDNLTYSTLPEFDQVIHLIEKQLIQGNDN